MFTSDKLLEKWQPILDSEDAPKLVDRHRKAVTATVLENTEKALAEERNHQGFLFLDAFSQHPLLNV